MKVICPGLGTKKKRISSLAMMLLALAAFSSPGAPKVDDGGRLWLNMGEGGYDYPAKYLYDVTFPYGKDEERPDVTLGDVVLFLSSGRADLESFINSSLGERTAELWFPYMAWYNDPMNPSLVSYWKSRGLDKYAHLSSETGIATDYYVYVPEGAFESGDLYPLILVMHGGGEPAQQAETFGFQRVAAREGIILVSAEDTSPSLTNEVLEAVIRDYPVDESRIYSTGSSQGGNNSKLYAFSYPGRLAAMAPMDTPPAISTHFFTPSEEQLENARSYHLPMLFLGGTADMYGMYSAYDRAFFASTYNYEEKYTKGWNELMDLIGVEGKDLTLEELCLNSDNPLNEGWHYTGFPFDEAVNIDKSGNSPAYLCSLDGVEDMKVCFVVNRPHMPSGNDAEVVWEFFRHYRRDTETGASIRID